MNRQEIINTPYGEFLDMVSCLSVYNGNAVEKSRRLSYLEAMELE